MNAQTAQIGLITVQMTYPGGLEKFEEDGGRLSYDQETLYFYHPTPPKEWMEALSAISNLRTKVVQTKNFGDDPEFEKVFGQIHSVLGGYKQRFIQKGIRAALSIDVVMVRVVLYGARADRGLAEEIVKALSEAVDHLVRLNVGYGLHPERDYVLYEAEQEHAVLSEQHPNRDTTISRDEITNLRIDLENAKTIDEFLEKL